MIPLHRSTVGLAGLLGLLGLACGGSDINTPEPVATTIAANGGNNQLAAPGAAVATPPSVKVTDAESNPVSDVAVTFAVASGGGSVTGASQKTNGSGIATVGSWTLGSTPGTNTLSATAAGLSGSPVMFSALGEGVTITAVSPTGGPLAGGTSATIMGTNFVDVTSVTIGGSELGSRTVVSPTQITGTTPASTSTGAKDVVVTSSSEGAASCSGCFSYVSDGGVVVVALIPGEAHTCALTGAGGAYCWGLNRYGGLGNGSTTDTPIPIAVSGGLSFSALALGAFHTCGLTSAGSAYCWGDNSIGQLGNGSFTSSSTPVAVSGSLSFTALALGSFHTCGLTSAGAIYCWGWNEHGQLGVGSFTNSSSTPVSVVGDLSFRALATGRGIGSDYSCGLTSAGAAYCWGGNGAGQLGNGSTTESSIPIAVSGGLSFSAIHAGGGHTCGISSAGGAYCWGANNYGELGNGSTTSSPAPVAVAGGLSFSALALGGLHTCGLTGSGVAYCWGENSVGQFGNGSTTSSSTPIVGPGDPSFSVVSLGTAHTCGLTSAGAAYCWGSNDHGQLGNGTTNNSPVPVPVSWPQGATVAAATPEGPRSAAAQGARKQWSRRAGLAR